LILPFPFNSNLLIFFSSFLSFVRLLNLDGAIHSLSPFLSLSIQIVTFGVMIFPFHSVALLLTLISSTHTLHLSDIPIDTPFSSLISTAKSHLANGSPHDALVFFDAAVARDPTNYLTIFQRGVTYLSLGRCSKATEDFDRVLEIKPDFEGALIQRAHLRAKSADWVGAKRDLAAAGKQDGMELAELEEAQVAAFAAQDAEKRGDWETCASQAGVAILKASRSLGLRQLRARCRFERGEVQEGINDLVHVLQISPGLIEPHLQISSMLFYSLADTDRGIAQIRKCLHSDPDSKVCSLLFRREKQIAKRLDSLSTLMEQRKFAKAAASLVGDQGESGLIDDVKADMKEARAAGHILPNVPDNLYAHLVEKTCESYREVRTLLALLVLIRLY
jgi:DnaJ family protein C protein 3